MKLNAYGSSGTKSHARKCPLISQDDLRHGKGKEMTNPADTLAALGLSVACEFVPLSKSRNATKAGPKSVNDLSLNWRVTALRNGHAILTTDYMQGIGHAPSYKASVRALGHANSLMRFEALLHEAEKGTRAPRVGLFHGPALTPPSAADVFYSLSMDASVLDSATFEEWASELGYDTDSRAAEKIYRLCLDIALKLRAAIGEAGLEQLREAFQDY